MNPNQSPAPWRENISDDGVLTVVMDESHDVVIGDLENTCATCHANASLIAAAPQLLETLIKIRDACKTSDLFMFEVIKDAAERAIAKAVQS